ncbi:isocyanide synthase family protein, partial [Aspergillus homomorphus CBS 101889]
GEAIANRLVEVFEQELLFQPPGSQWDAVGRAAMHKTISFFTARQLPFVMCLPAFPCKSSNLNKVGGVGPDRGEELALRRLHRVLGRLQDIYEPGAYLCIISDGHVFSDCNQYGVQLHNLNRAIGDSDSKRISFLSLPDLLEGGQAGHNLNLPAVPHHIRTKLTDESELCRQMLMHMCGSNSDSLRKQILNQDTGVLALYRGFARFMLEDLEEHAAAVALSRSQRKKLSEKLAFEMILRNQAYSNMTEMFLPHFLRLSIHSHPNSGPKFGICLFDRATTRVVSRINELASLGEFGDASPHLLHIPTPWHNCVFQIAGHEGIFVTKTKVVREGLSSGQVRGEWVTGDAAAGQGGYFAL